MSYTRLKISAKERHILAKLNHWNSTSVIYPHHKLVHQLFEYIASKYPDKTAVEHHDHTVSYSLLNQKSNQLARYLMRYQIGKGDLIAIMMDRSVEMIISILGILKAGAAYLPIEPSYPAERIRHILDDSQSKVILTKRNFLDLISFFNDSSSLLKNTFIVDMQTVNLDHEDSKDLYHEKASSEDLAYVIYTSGSTGKPKGVMVTHRNVNNYIYWFANSFALNRDSKLDFSSSLAFDFSVSCTLAPLLHGSCISICDERVKQDPARYLNFLLKNKITHSKNTPSYFSSLLLSPEQVSQLTSLEWIILGGEPINPQDIKQWFALNSKQKIVNEYGPTETTVATIAYIITSDSVKDDFSIPIGKPAFNTQIYILGKKGTLCEIGETGELCIAGDSVSNGYLKQPNLTKLKFVDNKFCVTTKSNIYKTGDLACWLPDGNIEYKGRTDNQVKIRGYRIELEEIEQILLRHQNITHACVIANKTKKGTYLVAFVVTKEAINEEKIRSHLQQTVPDYMAPSFFIFLDSLPLTAHEKANKEQLLKLIPKLSKRKIAQPTDEAEIDLLALYANFLPLPKESICINANFFNLGGNSLMAIRIINAINNKYKIKLNISDIITAPTISLMSNLIDSKVSNQHKQKFYESIHDHFSSLSILPLKKYGNKRPLFLLHPLGGTIFSYRELSVQIHPERPCYAIQDPSIAIGKPCFSSFEKMASCYLDLIRRIQPHGPYILSGHSFGGTLAFEIARQLLDQNETVDKIFLLDTWAFFTSDFQGTAHLDNSISTQLKNNKERLVKEQIENVDLWVELNQYRANLGKNYKPARLDTQLTLLKAESLLPEYQLIDEPTNYWHHYTTLPIKTIYVSGNHETMLTEGNAKTLASILEEELASNSIEPIAMRHEIV